MSLRGTASETSSIRSVSPDRRPELRGARSFTRYETVNDEEDPLSASLSRLKTQPIVSDNLDGQDESEDEDGNPLGALLPEDFDELPPELVSLTDRFIESLAKPVHPAPLTITQLAGMFQRFYGAAASQAISKHVAQSYLSLSSKKSQTRIPTQMLSKAEIVRKKRDRKLLELKRVALEEAVEKRVTEGVYDRLWRHKSTDDEARDDSLQSKIAALKVVGVNMGHLGVELEPAETVAEVDQELQEAVTALAVMSEQTYPLGKLALLKQAHKTIVDCLTKHISTTSADSLLPTLIYTLIISPPGRALNAVSNLYFIQRFRSSHFIDGEAAYCLTNLEAAISFLETVDLATLKIPSHDVTPSLYSTDSEDPLHPTGSEDPISRVTTLPPRVSTTSTDKAQVLGRSASSPPTGPSRKQPAISFPIDLATSAVSTADQSIRNIGFALESSYKFLFDRRGDAPVPKTLEDARKLVDNPQSPHLRIEEEEPEPKVVSSPAPTPLPPSILGQSSISAAGLEPLKNIGTSLGRFANMGMRGFTRSPVKELIPSTPAAKRAELAATSSSPAALSNTGPVGVGGTEKTVAVNRRFADLQDVAELKVGEVPALFEEYKRLVGELRMRGLAELS